MLTNRTTQRLKLIINLAVSVLFLLDTSYLHAAESELNEIIVVSKTTILNQAVKTSEAESQTSQFANQLILELGKRFPCAKIASEKEIPATLDVAKFQSVLGMDDASDQTLEEAKKMANSKYYLYVNFTYTGNRSWLTASLLDTDKARCKSKVDSDFDDLSPSENADIIKSICDDIEMNAGLCPWKGLVILSRQMSRDTTYSYGKDINVNGASEPGREYHKTEQSDIENQEYKFKVYSATFSSCDVQFNKKNKIVTTDKWEDIRCWAPNGDARYPANSSVLCVNESTINGAKEIPYASLTIENVPESEIFKISMSIPEQAFQATTSRKCVIEDSCNPKKEDNNSFSGDASVTLNESYLLEGYNKGDKTFKSTKTWKDLEGYTVKLECDLHR